MRVINQNIKRGEVRVKVENLDDLWYLSHIIELNDLIKGKTLRKIKLGTKEERVKASLRKPVFLIITVEKIELSEFSNTLRVGGPTNNELDDVPKGSYHTFNIGEDTIITIIKEKWLKYQFDKLKEAAKPPSKILICLFDREEAYFALLKKYGYDLLCKLKGNVAKKAVDSKVKDTFYSEIIKKIQDYHKRYNLQNIILASPSFWKEDLMKELKDIELKKKIVLATCSAVDESAINEVLKRPETQYTLKQDRLAKEANLVETLFTEIRKNNLAAYGIKEVEMAVNSGAVEKLLITNTMIHKTREEHKYYLIDELMKKTEQTKGNITIISSEHEAGKKLDGLGGIGAILRYKLQY